jgi:hypothetical protein
VISDRVQPEEPHLAGEIGSVGLDSFQEGQSMVHRLLNISVSGSLVFATAVACFIWPQPALAALSFHTCRSVEVSTYENRIHVRCSTAATGGIVFFAVPTANSAYAARVLSVLTAAHIAGKNIEIQYDPNDTSGANFGCAASDCRRMVSVGIR